MNNVDLYFREDPTGISLVTKELIVSNKKILKIEGEIVGLDVADKHCLQLNENQFLFPRDRPECFLNHSCEPNCFVLFENNEIFLVALRFIMPYYELTIDYETFEWDMTTGIDCGFKCNCGLVNCRKLIKGFKYLKPEKQKELESYLSPFLKEKNETITKSN